jgi:hypothetical protein
VLTGLARRKSTRTASAGPRVKAVEQTKYAIPNRLHYPEQAQTEHDANSVHDFKRNFGRRKPFYFKGFRNLHLIRHYQLRVRRENYVRKLDTKGLPTRPSILQELAPKDNLWLNMQYSQIFNYS